MNLGGGECLKNGQVNRVQDLLRDL